MYFDDEVDEGMPEFSLSDISIRDLKELINRGEGTFLEFKRKISSPEKIAREICAFANTNGGILLIGVDDDGSIIGVNNHFEESYLLEKAAKQVCRPSIKFHTEIIPYRHTEILLVRVDQSEKKPIYVRTKNQRTAYIREADESKVASEEMREILKNETSPNGVTFEYGAKEQKLFSYLRENGRITIQDLASLINVTSFRASQILINLVSAGILILYKQNNNEYYTFAGDLNQ